MGILLISRRTSGGGVPLAQDAAAHWAGAPMMLLRRLWMASRPPSRATCGLHRQGVDHHLTFSSGAITRGGGHRNYILTVLYIR